MIQCYKDYLEYLEADRVALGRQRSRPKLLGDEIWKFQLALRAVEYYTNCRAGTFSGRILCAFWRFRMHQLALKCGFSISPNSFGPGLAIVHRGTVIINAKAKIGACCRLHACVVIGASGGDSDAVPRIGDNVYIGPGAKIFGAIEVADGIAVAANSVVNRSFTEPGIGIGGIPAKKINDKGSATLIKELTQG